MVAGIGATVGIAAIVVVVATALYTISAVNGCVNSLFDDPIGDSAEAKAFIYDPTVTERDLETFDILRGSFEKMHLHSRTSPTLELEHLHAEEAVAAVDQFRARLEQGSWPAEDPVFAGPDSNLSPQLWVRLAQLSLDYIQEQTGESWRILNLSYPFPSNGPIPWPATRDEGTSVFTSFECETGPDKGLVTTVRYYRWARPAYFEHDVEESRAEAQEQLQAARTALSSPALEGRTCLYEPYRNIYVWSTGEDDSLREPAAFTALLEDLSGQLGDQSVSLTLLEADAPIVATRHFSGDYASNETVNIYGVEDAQVALCNDAGIAVDFAPADQLLSQHYSVSSDGVGELDELSGYLVPSEYPSDYTWRAPQEGYAADDAATAVVARQLDVPEEQVVALSKYGGESNALYDEAWSFHIVVQHSAFPDTPKAVDDAMVELQRALWDEYFMGKSDASSPVIHVYVIVVEDGSIEGPDGAMSFGDMRAAAQDDPASLGDFAPEFLFRASMSGYGDEGTPIEEGWGNDFGVSVDGPLAKQRTWFLESRNLS